MALVTVSFGKRVESADVNQLVGLLKGTADYGDAVLLTAYSNADNWALTARNQNTTTGRAFRLQNAEGTQDILTVRRVSGSDVVTIGNVADGSQPTTTKLGVYHTQSSGAGYVMLDATLNVSAASSDSGAIRGVGNATAGDSAVRGVEAHALRQSGAGGAAVGTYGLEVSAQRSAGATGTHTGVVGVYLYSDNAQWGLGGTATADTGLLIGGTNAWNNAIVYLDTDGLTELFKVGPLGVVDAGTIRPRADNTYSVGASAGLAYAVMYSRIFAAGAAGSAGAPNFTSGVTNENDNGMYLPGSNVVGFSTAGLQRLLIDAAGNVVVNAGAIATNSTDGFLYIPTCAGTPTGTPTSHSGRVAMVYDSTNNELYIYDAGWVSTAVFA